MLLFCALSVLTVSCAGGERPTVTREPPAPPRPAPTIEGVTGQIAAEAIAAQAVVVGLDGSSLIEVRAQPGLGMPLVGAVPASTVIDPMGQYFTTSDQLEWWQVRAGDIQGWTNAPIAYQGPATVLTESIDGAIGDTSFPSADDAAAAIAAGVALDRGSASSVVISKNEIVGQNSITVTTDVLIQNESIAAIRLVTAARQDGGTWRPVSVTQYELCTRGVNGAGICL